MVFDTLSNAVAVSRSVEESGLVFLLDFLLLWGGGSVLSWLVVEVNGGGEDAWDAVSLGLPVDGVAKTIAVVLVGESEASFEGFVNVVFVWIDARFSAVTEGLVNRVVLASSSWASNAARIFLDVDGFKHNVVSGDGTNETNESSELHLWFKK